MKAAVSYHSRRVTVDDYVAPTKTSGISYSIAHFLDWAAQKLPNVPISLQQITKSTRNFTRMPRSDSDEVAVTKRAMQRVRIILQEKFNRTLVMGGGIGARATVDSADVVRTEFKRKVKGVQTATTSLLRVTSLVNEAELPTTADFRDDRNWFEREKKGLIKLIGSKQFKEMLLLPEETETSLKPVES